MTSIALFYTGLFVVTLSTISWTLYNYPLFPLQTNSLEWSNAWLAATVIDYYGSTLCLCGVIFATADSLWAASIWIAGCCLLGSPVSCAWIIYQVWGQKRSLRLANNARSRNSPTPTSNENSSLFWMTQSVNSPFSCIYLNLLMALESLLIYIYLYIYQ